MARQPKPQTKTIKKTMAKPLDPLNCSILQAAKCLGVDRNTVSKWMGLGAPYLQKAEGNKPWQLSVPDIIKWKIELEKEKAVAAALEKAGASVETEDGVVSIDEAKRRKAVADAVIAEIKMDKEAASVIPVQDVCDLVAREYVAVREGILGIGPRVAPRIVGQTDATVIAEEIRTIVDETLEALNADTKTDWEPSDAA